MNKFSKWLAGHPNEALALRESMGVKRSFMSQLKNDRASIPQRWMPHIVKISAGQLTLDDLVKANLDRLKKLRIAKAGSPQPTRQAEATSTSRRPPKRPE